MAVHAAREIYRFARLAGFSPDQATTMTAIALAESGGDSRAHNPHGEDSRGLWQINLNAHRDWAGRRNLYDPLENARAAFRVSGGGKDVSPWTVTHGGRARYLSFKDEAQAAARACGDPPGLGVWTGTPGYGHRLAAGQDGAGAALAATASGDTAMPADPGAPAGSGSLRTFLDAALAQTGDRYVFGAEARTGDANPEVFDCSELVQWAAQRAGVTLPDGSWLQYLELQQQGSTVSVEQALRTPGALLFSFSRPPTASGGRPGQAHVAISLGDGRTIEARSSKYGVGSWSAADRFQYAAVIPGISDGGGGAAAVSTAAYANAAAFISTSADGEDTDKDGLTSELEQRLGLDAASVDTDKDNVSDGYELLTMRTDPRTADTDRDQIPDSMEVALGTDPTNPDTDREGRLDGAENREGGSLDSDQDGLSDELEALLGTDPRKTDSDGDGFVDGAEYQAFFDPADPASNPLAEQANPLAGQGNPAPESRTPAAPGGTKIDPQNWGLGELDPPAT